MRPARPILLVFLPFVSGYFVSYLFRTINALISPQLASDLGLVGRRAPSQDAGVLGLKAIYGDPRFWRVAPLSATCIGTAWALQGLWAAPWLTDVKQMEQTRIVAGALLLGAAADRLRRRGIPPRVLLGWAAFVFIVAQTGSWRRPA